MAFGAVPSRLTYAGLFLVALATVTYEIVLTRIFSVTMWYHFAFVAISVAMFGLTVGALVVYLRPRWFATEPQETALAGSALAFAIAIVPSLLTHLVVPFAPEPTLMGLWSVVLTYVAMATPFVASGVCVTLALTRFPRHLGRLYAADLIGAAAGCLVVILVIDGTDGPTAVVAVAGLASLGAALFAAGDSRPALRIASLLAVIVFSFFVAANSLRLSSGDSLLRLTWVKGAPEARPLYERWNSFSRITVRGDPARPSLPWGWGLSSLTPTDRPVRQLMLQIDAAAGTVLTAFDGRPEAVEHLKYDVTNVAHWLRPRARVLVVGVGGGRDILSALAFGQQDIVGVEINGAIIETVNEQFADFTGQLDRRPGVTFVNDEARSYIARRDDRFDILQISVIDTWAATGAGAFVLTEHSLYTREAWQLFLDRLTPRGILAVSRYYLRDRPDEMYRLTALAGDALRRHGVPVPRTHLAIVRQLERKGSQVAPVGVATLLASPSPFSPADLDTVEAVAGRLGFDVVLSARHAIDETFAALTGAADPAPFLAAFPVNIAAPTDDRPFFFYTLRLGDVFSGAIWRGDHLVDPVNMKAVSVLGVLLVTVLGLTALCVIVPLALTTDRTALGGSVPLFVFFGAIGLGFMLVEISQMQRLMIFLGHPIYGLSVVLFAMLVSSGVGSMLTERLTVAGRCVALPLAALLLVLGVFGLATPAAIRAFAAGTTPTRVVVSVAILFPLGVLMGMAFPLGMRLAARGAASLTPWLWGINGATSVCASVLAVVIALGAGIAASFWMGVVCYAVAAGALLVASAESASCGAGSASSA